MKKFFLMIKSGASAIKQNKVSLGALVFFLTSLLPFVYTIFLSIPSDDDFCEANRVFGSSNLFFSSLSSSIGRYMSWGGDWPLTFLQILCNPLVYSPYNGTGHSMGLFLLFQFLLFWAVVLWLTYSISKYVLRIENDTVAVLIPLCFAIAFLNSDVYREIYYWYVGNSYLWAAIAVILCQVVMIRFFYVDCRLSIGVLLCLMGFLSCFSINFAVFQAMVLLWIVFDSCRNRSASSFIPLFFMIIGGSLSAFSPGNFVRRSAFTGERFGLSEAFLMAYQHSARTLMDAFCSPTFVCMAVLFIFLGYRYSKNKVTAVKLMITVFFGLISLLGVLLPMTYGYSNNEFPNRMCYCANLVIYFWIMIETVYLGCWLRTSIGEIFVLDKPGIVASVCVIILVVGMTYPLTDGHVAYEEQPILKTALRMDECLEESRFYRSVFREIANSDQNEVYLWYSASDIPQRTQIMMKPHISADSSGWINQAVAIYFDKSSVIMVVE